MFLDVGMSRFNSRGCPVIKVSDFFCPGVNKTGSKRNPSFFNVFNELRIKHGDELLERRVKIGCVRNLEKSRPMMHDFLLFFIIFEKFGSVGEYILLNVPGSEHVSGVWEEFANGFHESKFVIG